MFARVAIDLALDRLFTYEVPAELEKKLAVGQLLSVPFGHRTARGFVMDIGDEGSGVRGRNRPLRVGATLGEATKPSGASAEGAGVRSQETGKSQESGQLSKKELRQQRAAERAKIAPKLRELKKRVETAEKKIDELQKALDEASAELFNPKPDTDFAEANRKVRTLQFEIDRYTADWEEAATELEALEAEKPQ